MSSFLGHSLAAYSLASSMSQSLASTSWAYRKKYFRLRYWLNALFIITQSKKPRSKSAYVLPNLVKRPFLPL